MDEKELKLLLEGVAKDNGKAIQEAVKTQVDAATAGLLKAADFATKLETLGLKDDVIKTLTDAITKQGEEMRRFNNGHAAAKRSLSELITEKAEIIKAIAKGGPNVKFTVDKTLLTRGALGVNTLGMRLPEISPLAYPNSVISSLFRHADVSPNSNGVIRYFDEATVTRGAAFIAEAATKPESAITWVEQTLLIQKVADSIPVTKEAWMDIAFIESEIRRLLEVNITLKIDDQLYDGDGIPPNIKGVYTSAPAFVDTPYIDSVEGANLFDLILVVAADIANTGGGKYAPNTVLLNPINMLGLNLAKDTGGRYLIPPFASLQGSSQSIGGLRIVASSQVTANTMVVGDFNYGTVYDLEDFNIEMGWINDQFIKNCFTILAEQRLALLIRNGDVGAFRKVINITTTLANLETP